MRDKYKVFKIINEGNDNYYVGRMSGSGIELPKCLRGTMIGEIHWVVKRRIREVDWDINRAHGYERVI